MTTHVNTKEKAHKLFELIDYYEVCNRAEGKSPKTISWYSANLKSFRNYLKNRHLSDSLDNIDTKLLREYVLYLLKKTRYENHPYTPAKTELLSTSTVHGHVRTLRAFFNWLVAEGLAQNNPAKDLKPPKVIRKVVSTLSDEEIRAILNSFSTSPSDARNQTLFMILLDTGLRIGELVNLKMDDVHMDEGYLKVLGKGKKERIVPIGNNAQKVLQRYLFRFRAKPTNPVTDNVFLSVSSNPLTENSMKLMFARLSKRSGVCRLHAHLCRHTFATRFLINGGDVFTLQQILGHSTLTMVSHYVNLASSHIAIQHQGQGYVCVFLKETNGFNVYWVKEEEIVADKAYYAQNGSKVLSVEEASSLIDGIMGQLGSGNWAEVVDWVKKYAMFPGLVLS